MLKLKGRETGLKVNLMDKCFNYGKLQKAGEYPS